jgi:hypothetical protein
MRGRVWAQQLMNPMRTLAKILLAGFLAFMAIAVVEEREIFFPGIAFGGDSDGDSGLRDEEKSAAAGAVREMLALYAHYYGTGGDERFVERMPASDAVKAEMEVDIRYLRANHRRQEPTLQRLEVLSVRPLGEETVEVKTKEFWIHRIFWIGEGGGESEPARSQIVYGTYLVSKQAQSWRVEGWEFARPEDAAGEGGRAGR